jgi:hypothetical protein
MLSLHRLEREMELELLAQLALVAPRLQQRAKTMAQTVEH